MTEINVNEDLNLNQSKKNSRVVVYEKTPFTITQEDVLLFNSLEEQIEYFNNLPSIYDSDTVSYIKNTNYINVKLNKNELKNATYLRINNGEKWIYAFIVDTIYVNKATTIIIFEYDYFNTYQQYIDFNKISGTVEQSHLKRIENNQDNILLNSQGFDVGEKQVINTLRYDFGFLWLVIVTKPSIKIGSTFGLGTISGVYKPFHYFILPVDKNARLTKRFKVGEDYLITEKQVPEIIETLTNTFDTDNNINTVNQIVNIYTTRDIGINYTFNKETNTVIVDKQDFLFVPFGDPVVELPTIPDYETDPDYTNIQTTCPKMPTGNASIKFTSLYGYRDDPVTNEPNNWHNGLDIAPSTSGAKIPIYAVQDGIVKFTGDTGNGFGNFVEITHTAGDKNLTLYAHLDSYIVGVGDKVKQGQQIGTMGTTGKSTGVHLHFEVHENVTTRVSGKDGSSIDPKPYLTECKESLKEPNSTFTGSISYTNYLKDPATLVTLDENTIRRIISACKSYKILPTAVICQFWIEARWGDQYNATVNKNWGGITWVEPNGNNLDDYVTSVKGRYRGTARPVDEGGHYTAYKDLEYFFLDYFCLLSETGYNVTGKYTLDEFVKGLFVIGNGTKNYAASGYESYLKLMRSVYSGIQGANPNFKDIDNEVLNG